jgi:hypothetical protein
MKPSVLATVAIAVIGFPLLFSSVSTRFALPGPLAQMPVYPSSPDAQPSAAGELNASFNAQLLRAGSATTLAQQSDQNIVVGGFFNHVNGVARNHIARLNTYFTFDTSFNLDSGPDTYGVYAPAIQSDGKIISGLGRARG